MEQVLKLDVPKVFGIPITDKCHLRCNFCFNTDDRFASATHMDLDEFKRIVDWATSQGIRFIDITPTVGEALLIPNLNEYLDYLDASDIQMYTLITTLAHKNISMLFNRPKLLLEVSLYGGTRDQYRSVTGRDVFDLVRANIQSLSTRQLNVLKRFPGNDMDVRLSVLLKGMSNIKLLEFSENRPISIPFNGQLKKCQFMTEPLLTTNGISLCCIDYNYTDYIIGQVGDDIQTVYDNINSTIKNKQLKCSTACGWYKPWAGDRGLDER